MMAFSSGLSVPTISAQEGKRKRKAESGATQKILQACPDMQKTRGRMDGWMEERLRSLGEPDLS